jgi:hypothetical protein
MTLGEYRVGVDFNPSGSVAVMDVKAAAAAIIDKLHDMKTAAATNDPERLRLFDIAINAFEAAAMWGVKAVTKRPRNAA